MGVSRVQPAGAPGVTNHNLTYPFTFTSFAVSLLLVFRCKAFADQKGAFEVDQHHKA